MLPGITNCRMLHMPLGGPVCFPGVRAAFGHCHGVTLWKRYQFVALCILFLLPYYFNYLRFLIQPSTFLILFILSAERLQISPAMLTRSCAAEADLSATDSCPSIAKACLGTVPGVCEEFQVRVRSSRYRPSLLTTCHCDGNRSAECLPVESCYGDSCSLRGPLQALRAPLDSCEPQLP